MPSLGSRACLRWCQRRHRSRSRLPPGPSEIPVAGWRPAPTPCPRWTKHQRPPDKSYTRLVEVAYARHLTLDNFQILGCHISCPTPLTKSLRHSRALFPSFPRRREPTAQALWQSRYLARGPATSVMPALSSRHSRGLFPSFPRRREPTARTPWPVAT